MYVLSSWVDEGTLNILKAVNLKPTFEMPLFFLDWFIAEDGSALSMNDRVSYLATMLGGVPKSNASSL